MARQLKPLYLCKSFDELVSHSRDHNFHEESTKSLLSISERVYLEAIRAEVQGDEERAYYFHYQSSTAIYTAMENGDVSETQTPAYQEKLQHSIEASRNLEVSLQKRYEDLKKSTGVLVTHSKDEPVLLPQKINSIHKDTDLEDEQCCPICVSIPPGKIFQCREGHIVCESCLQKIQENARKINILPKCPCCIGRLDNDTVSRCRVLENILDRLTIDCVHKNNGCSAWLKRDSIQIHESSCVYGLNLDICGMLESTKCNFKLSISNASLVFQHIKSCHPSKKIKPPKFSEIWDLKKPSETVSASTHANKTIKYVDIVQVPNRKQCIAVIAEVSRYSVSFYTIDLSLGLSAEYKACKVTFSIVNDTEILMLWSIPVTRGIESWKLLKDQNCKKPIEIGIQSLLQHCDENGLLKINVVFETEK